MRRHIYLYILLIIVVAVSGCVTPDTVSSVYNAERASSEKLADEGTIVFVRPKNYNIFGTESIRDYVEVTYERASRNNVDLLKIDLGLRNRGGQRFYDSVGPSFQISVKTDFFEKPLISGKPQAAPVYETNWQAVKLLRGATEHYQVVCPIKTGGYYQVTISELLQ